MDGLAAHLDRLGQQRGQEPLALHHHNATRQVQGLHNQSVQAAIDPLTYCMREFDCVLTQTVCKAMKQTFR